MNTGTYKSLHQLNYAPHKLLLSLSLSLYIYIYVFVFFFFNDHTEVLHSKIYCSLNFDFTPNPESPK